MKYVSLNYNWIVRSGLIPGVNKGIRELSSLGFVLMSTALALKDSVSILV